MTRFTFKGYLVKLNPLTGLWAISKDGFHIGTASSELDAKVTIELLT